MPDVSPKTSVEMLRSVSRTFALSIEQLPGVLSDAVSVSYLLLRVSDCLEDHGSMPPVRKAELLRLWADVLDQGRDVTALTERISDLDGSDPEVYVAQHAARVLEMLGRLPDPLQEAIILRVAKTSRGMARWQEHCPQPARASQCRCGPCARGRAFGGMAAQSIRF